MKTIILTLCLLSLSYSNSQGLDEVIRVEDEGNTESTKVREVLAAAHHEKHHSRSRERHCNHCSDSKGCHRKHKSDLECSVDSSYCVSGIDENQVCRNTATSDTTSCVNCCVASYLDEHNYANPASKEITVFGKKTVKFQTDTGVLGFISVNPKDSNQNQCVCCSPKKEHHKCRPNLIPLTSAQLVEYAAIYDKTSYAGSFTGFGKVKFLKTNNGFVATCQCKPDIGNSCWLEFDNAIDTFLTKNSTAFGIKKKADGSYNLLSATLVTCDKSGLNVINGTTSTHITCYSYHFLDSSQCCD